jgi:hypothetical protein
MVADFIIDVLSIPVGNAEVLNLPHNFSVNLTFSSSTDYALFSTTNFQNNVQILTALTYTHSFPWIPVFWDLVIIIG